MSEQPLDPDTWAIIVRHPSLCTCADCVVVRRDLGTRMTYASNCGEGARVGPRLIPPGRYLLALAAVCIPWVSS